MKKYEEMLQNLDEQNRNIVLDAMQHHDKHYQAMVSWSKRNYIQWQKLYSIMAGIYWGVADYKDLYYYLEAESESAPDGDAADFQYMICEGSTVARVMYEKYNSGKSGKEMYREELMRQYNEVCQMLGFDETIEDLDEEIKYITELTKNQVADIVILASGLGHGKEYELLKRVLKEGKYFEDVDEL